MEFDVVQGDVAAQSADALRCTSVVLPAIGCGVAGFALEDGAAIICEEVDAFRPRSLDDVRLIAYADDEYETMRDVAERVRRRSSV